MTIVDEFAILAPVPEPHLQSGFDRLQKERLDFLAYGSAKIGDNTTERMLNFFKKVDADCHGQSVPLLIYPSRERTEEKPPYQVAWVGLYVGHCVADASGLHPDGWRYRPDTTLENYESNKRSERWLLYWHVKDLRPLLEDEQVEIAMLGRERSAKPWPLGPEVVRSSAASTILKSLGFSSPRA